MTSIPIVLDPALKIDLNQLREAWNSDTELASKARLEHDTLDLESYTFAEVALALAPIAVTVTTTVATQLLLEVLKRAIFPPDQPKAPEVTVTTQTLPDGREVILVQQKGG